MVYVRGVDGSGGSLHRCKPRKRQVDFTMLNLKIFQTLGGVATSSAPLTPPRCSLEHVRLTRKILGLSILLCMMKTVSLAVNVPLYRSPKPFAVLCSPKLICPPRPAGTSGLRFFNKTGKRSIGVARSGYISKDSFEKFRRVRFGEDLGEGIIRFELFQWLNSGRIKNSDDPEKPQLCVIHRF